MAWDILCGIVRAIVSCSWYRTQVERLAFSPDGNLLAAGCADGHIYIYGFRYGNWVQVSHNKYHSNDVRRSFLNIIFHN